MKTAILLMCIAVVVVNCTSPPVERPLSQNPPQSGGFERPQSQIPSQAGGFGGPQPQNPSGGFGGQQPQNPSGGFGGQQSQYPSQSGGFERPQPQHPSQSGGFLGQQSQNPSQRGGFGPERGGTEDDLNQIRRFSDDIARRISQVRSKYSRDPITRLDLFAVREFELPGGDRTFLYKLQANYNQNDVWFVNFYRVFSSPQHSHVSGVDQQRHNLNDPLVEFPIQQNAQ